MSTPAERAARSLATLADTVARAGDRAQAHLLWGLVQHLRAEAPTVVIARPAPAARPVPA